MIAIKEMNDHVTFSQQLATPSGPMVFVNVFTVAPDDVEQFLRAWSLDARIIKQQPGLISIQLHRGIGGSPTFMNYAVWESMEAYQRFMASGVLRTSGSAGLYPASAAMSPHLFHKVGVPGICVA